MPPMRNYHGNYILHLVKAQCHPESKVRKSVLRGRRPAPLFSKWQTCVRMLGPMSRSRTSKRHAKRINLSLQIYLNFAFQKNIFCSFHRLFVVFLVRRHRKRGRRTKLNEPVNKIAQLAENLNLILCRTISVGLYVTTQCT